MLASTNVSVHYANEVVQWLKVDQIAAGNANAAPVLG